MFAATHLIGFGASAGYATGASNFDGTNDWGLRGADLTGNADGKKGLVSFWVRFQGGNAALQRIYDASGTVHNIQRSADDTFRFFFGSGVRISASSTGTYVVASGWVHVLAAWDLATPVFRLFINNADDEAGGSTESGAADIDYTLAQHTIGASDGGGASILNADLADFYFNMAETLDISTAANRARFISGGKPVDLGADGALPTGTAPIIFLRRVPGASADSFLTNKGTGGGFTVTGALTASTTTPSD